MKILITAGGTSEAIDAVRSIKNEATGKLSMHIAEAFVKQHADVEIYYVHDKKAYVPSGEKIYPYVIESVAELEKTMRHIITTNDIQFVFHAMAVSDYKTEAVVSNMELETLFSTWNTNQKRQMTYADFKERLLQLKLDRNKKISSNYETLLISMTKTPKIIEQIKKWDPRIQLIGFKLLQGVTKEVLIDVAYQQLVRNDEICVVANDKKDISDTMHKAYIIGLDKHYIECETKEEIAAQLVKILKR